MKTRLQIDRLVLRAPGLSPTAAEAVARAIPPALAAQLQSRPTPRGPIPTLAITAAPTDSPAQIARQIAAQLSSPPGARP